MWLSIADAHCYTRKTATRSDFHKIAIRSIYAPDNNMPAKTYYNTHTAALEQQHLLARLALSDHFSQEPRLLKPLTSSETAHHHRNRFKKKHALQYALHKDAVRPNGLLKSTDTDHHRTSSRASAVSAPYPASSASSSPSACSFPSQ